MLILQWHKTLAKSIKLLTKQNNHKNLQLSLVLVVVFEKVNQKLVMVEANMDVKISDFDVTA
jgi:hypothetical protein